MVRHGSSPYFKVPDAVGDVRRALRYIRYHAAKFVVDPDRLGVFGNSAGGHLALMLGTASDDGQTGAEDPVDGTAAKVAAVVAYYPPVDLRRAEPPSTPSSPQNFDPELQDSVSPILHVTSDDPPTLLIHGDQDKAVPLSDSEGIYDSFKAADVPSRLVVIEGAGHGFPGAYGQEAAAALADWFDQHLRGLSAD
jgi:acetyl esterase/lipase